MTLQSQDEVNGQHSECILLRVAFLEFLPEHLIYDLCPLIVDAPS